jgi:hypothetical protein
MTDDGDKKRDCVSEEPEDTGAPEEKGPEKVALPDMAVQLMLVHMGNGYGAPVAFFDGKHKRFLVLPGEEMPHERQVSKYCEYAKEGYPIQPTVYLNKAAAMADQRMMDRAVGVDSKGSYRVQFVYCNIRA